MKDIMIFVYGSCHYSERINSESTVGDGGYGIVINEGGVRQEIAGGLSKTTNARMDIIGLTEALKRVVEPSNISVYLANSYVTDTLSKGWLQKWKLIGFRDKKHADLWTELDKIITSNKHNISFHRPSNQPDYQLAERLGKEMSSKKNPPDLMTQVSVIGTNPDSSENHPAPNSLVAWENEQENEAMIETVKVFSLIQKYDDGRPDKVWSVGDDTKDGKITEFNRDANGYWYAITDTPSDWQKQNGQTTGWSWIFQLESKIN